LAGLEPAAIEALLRDLGEPPYRARQLFDWVQAKGASSYEDMTNLPKSLREKLAAHHPVRTTRVLSRCPSDDGTVKLLLELADKNTVECVLIPEGDRATACISTQVGCGVGCIFCASGADGVVRNLDAAELVEQVHHLEEEAAASLVGAKARRLSNIVVMGMGEPLHNVDALVRALRLLQHPEGIDLGSRRITVSTSGPPKGFRAFLESGQRVKLAISLHAPRDDLRKRLVPRGGSDSVQELRAMAEEWFKKTGRDVTFEYVLIHGVNDSDREAEELARLCGRHFNVNLIPMNPVSFAPALRAPRHERSERFAALLEERGVVVHLRRQRGDDVAAACGQLRLSRQPGA
jgi:23S rRNA (adenine2503-C2)-methyltransferase